MNEAVLLAQSIAARVHDYRTGEISPIDFEDVLRWASQFNQPHQVDILRELDFVLGITYWSKERALRYFQSVVTNASIVGGEPSKFWESSSFIQQQQRGSSQRILLQMFDSVMLAACGIGLSDCQGERLHVYLDDGLFSGGHMVADVGRWIKLEAPRSSSIAVITLVSHSSGRWWAENRLHEIATECGKRITVRFYEGSLFTNAKTRSQNAAVLWPNSLPEGGPVADYVAALPAGTYQLRNLDGSSQPSIFSSEGARQLLEQEMLNAGVAIRAKYDGLANHWRPLGNSGWGLGFGSMVVTFINCPNNCPLAFWWGDLEWPPRYWYPLFPRRTNATQVTTTDDIDDIPF